jgi:hypothetical protein
MPPLPPFLLPAAAPPAPLLSPSPSLPSPASSSMVGHGAQSLATAASHGKTQPSSVFFMGQLKRMCTTFLLLSLSSILSETNSNLRILRDFVFQPNSDFISNSNFNPSELLPHTYIRSGAPPPCPSMQILPQNQTLAVTRVPPPSPVPLARRQPCSKVLP